MTDETLEGGCHCGAIRYQIRGKPLRASICHCSDCRRSSGAPAVAWMLVEADALDIAGEPRAHESSPGVERLFCPSCGTGLFYRSETIFPGKVDVQLATLDDPESVRPTEQVQTDDRLGWMEGLDSLPAHRRYPPD